MRDTAGVPLVSVLLPVRDGQRFLDEAVGSVLRQTLSDLELLVVDDASTDRTPQLLSEWATRDRRVRLLSDGRRRGVAGSLNVALAAADAPFVARMDADDVCHPRRLERQIALLRVRPELAGCGSAAQHIDARGRVLPALLRTVPHHPVGVRACTALGTPLLHPTVVLRTDVLRGRGGYAEAALLEDLELWLRCGDLELANLAQPLLRYRVHGANATAGARGAGAAQLVHGLVAYLERLLHRPVEEDVARLLLDPRSAAGAEPQQLRDVVGLLEQLVTAAGPDRVAALDRALSTTAVLWVTRLRGGRPPLTLAGHGPITAGRVCARAARGGYVGVRRQLAARTALSR
jgi:glycosyltransferase involved in cell wall biosynthesis